MVGFWIRRGGFVLVVARGVLRQIHANMLENGREDSLELGPDLVTVPNGLRRARIVEQVVHEEESRQINSETY